MTIEQSPSEDNLSNLRELISHLRSGRGDLPSEEVVNNLEAMALRCFTLEVALLRACQLASNENKEIAADLFERLIAEAAPNVRHLYYETL